MRACFPFSSCLARGFTSNVKPHHAVEEFSVTVCEEKKWLSWLLPGDPGSSHQGCNEYSSHDDPGTHQQAFQHHDLRRHQHQEQGFSHENHTVHTPCCRHQGAAGSTSRGGPPPQERAASLCLLFREDAMRKATVELSAARPSSAVCGSRRPNLQLLYGNTVQRG